MYHIARPGEATLARLTRSGGATRFKMVAVHGKFVSSGAEEDEKLAAIELDNWPHAFARYDCDMETLIQAMSCNHIPGALKVFCESAGVEFVNLSK